jgi:hypothetical protein
VTESIRPGGSILAAASAGPTGARLDPSDRDAAAALRRGGLSQISATGPAYAFPRSDYAAPSAEHVRLLSEGGLRGRP